MADAEQFKTTVFGGFDKQDVLACVDRIIKNYEEKIQQVRQQAEEQQQELTEQQQTKLRQAVLQVQTLKKQLHENERNYQQVVEEKNKQIDAQTMSIRQLEYKCKSLEDRLAGYKSLEEERQSNVELTEKTARERTQKIIQKAKQQVEEEYQQKLTQAQEEIKRLKRQAREEGTAILQNAAERSRQLTAQAQKEVQRMLDSAHSQAEEAVARAEKTAQSILQNAAGSAVELQDPEPSLPSGFDFDALQQQIEQEISVAMQHLDSADLSVQTAKEKISGIKVPVVAATPPASEEETRRYKRALNNYFRQRDKE